MNRSRASQESQKGKRKRRSKKSRTHSHVSHHGKEDHDEVDPRQSAAAAKPTTKGLSRLMLWQKTWLNSKWRKRWRKKWGKNRWKLKLKVKWISNKKWRRKWMTKLRKNWWNMKWRRMWQKNWLDPIWWAKLEKERKRRKRFWMRKWRTSGCKIMGLTFHQFLVTQRRIKALKNVRPSHIQRRRREKRLNRESLIQEKQLKREQYDQERKKYGFFLTRWFHWVFATEHFGPETYDLKPAIIQFNLYMLNAIQGICSFAFIFILNIEYSDAIPSATGILGLYIISYFATAMDFFGSIFGMLTSYHLETYYGKKSYKEKTSSFFHKCRRCFRSKKVGQTGSKLNLAGPSAMTGMTPRLKRLGSNRDMKSWKAFVKGIKKRKVQPANNNNPESRSSVPSLFSVIKKAAGNDNSNSKLKILLSKSELQSKSSHRLLLQEDSDQRILDSMKNKRKPPRCNCKGSKCFLCVFYRACFSPGKSRTFVNRLGYMSWIMLQLAWFVNLFFLAYYSWVKLFSPSYGRIMTQCKVQPLQLFCYNFNKLYYELMTIVGATFMVRNILTFFIGMCFSERYLKHIPACEPNYEIATTCSDSEIDYEKVPHQILIPYLLSNGRYPYSYPGSTNPRKKLKKELKKKLKEASRKRAKERMEGREEKHRRRILSAREREAMKLMQGFRGIRRAEVPLPKGRRKPLKIPLVTGVPDSTQLPPDLMTTRARAWLSGEDSTDSLEGPSKPKNKDNASVLPHRRKRRLRRNEKVESSSLIVMHRSESRIKMSINQAIHDKVAQIQKRLSTDESWSSDGSLFETRSGYQAEVEDQVDHQSDEEYMQLMKANEELLKHTQSNNAAF